MHLFAAQHGSITGRLDAIYDDPAFGQKAGCFWHYGDLADASAWRG